MTSYVPHTDEDFARMLADIGLSSVDELFASIPPALRLAGGLDLAPGLSEPDAAAGNGPPRSGATAPPADLVCFAGGGAYDHDIPAVTRALAGRSEFVTSYTPYQPEVAQGVLQALFEYQTLVSRLAGLPVANASVYDGATATVEAVNLAVAATGRETVWVSAGMNPRWREALGTLTAGKGLELVDVPLVDRCNPLGGGGRSGPGERRRRTCGTGRCLPELPGLRRSRYRRPRTRPARRGRCWWPPSTPWLPGYCGRPANRGQTWPWPRVSRLARPWLSVGLTSACSPSLPSMCDAFPGGWSAGPPTARDGRPTSPHSGPGNRTSGGKRRHRTFAPTRPSSPWPPWSSWPGWARTGCASWRCGAPEGLATPAKRCWPYPASSRSPRPLSLTSSPSNACSRRTWWSSAWLRKGSWPGLPIDVGGESGLLVAVTEKRTRSEIDAYAAAHGEGGVVSVTTNTPTR